MLLDKIKNRLVIVCGHYGTGKTNVAVNLAKTAAKSGRRVCIADLDIVNPYFRSADNAAELSALGVRCIIPQFANTNVDIPSLPAELSSAFYGDELCIIDVGGDDGAVALAVYRDRIISCGYDMLYVYNACRPLIAETDDAVTSLREIEALSGLKVTGIVNNTNLGSKTTVQTVSDGEVKCAALSAATGIPIYAVSVLRGVGAVGGERLFLMENATKQLF